MLQQSHQTDTTPTIITKAKRNTLRFYVYVSLRTAVIRSDLTYILQTKVSHTTWLSIAYKHTSTYIRHLSIYIRNTNKFLGGFTHILQANIFKVDLAPLHAICVGVFIACRLRLSGSTWGWIYSGDSWWVIIIICQPHISHKHFVCNLPKSLTVSLDAGWLPKTDRNKV